MTKLYVKEGRRYRVAGRTDIAEALFAAVAAELHGRQIISPDHARDFVIEALSAWPAEQFAVLYLNARYCVIAFEIAFRGTLDATAVHPREIVRRAIELNAGAVIFAHNHPSGQAEPSDADRLVTRRLRDALELIDVRTLDHLVVGSTGKVVSLAERGLM